MFKAIGRPIFALIFALFMGIFAASSASNPAQAQNSDDFSQSHVSVRLISAAVTIAPGSDVRLVLEQKIADGWHTYWQNPGDSGLTTEISWTLPNGASAGPLLWPVPTALPFEGMINYGFGGTVALPVTIHVPENAVVGSNFDIKGDVSWLECADICIPGSGTVALSLPVGAAMSDGPDKALVDSAFAAIPQKIANAGRLYDGGDHWVLVLDAPQLAGKNHALFFPYGLESGALIDYPAAQTFYQHGNGLVVTLKKSTTLPDPIPQNLTAYFVANDGTAFDIGFTYENGPLPEGLVSGQGSENLPGQHNIAAENGANASIGAGLLVALFSAFLGGMILNLLPCVFPILAIKALSLVRSAQDDGTQKRKEALFYSLGSVLSFLALGLLLIVLKSLGQQLGWGFQLQSPFMLMALIALLSVVGFSLLDWITIGGSFQNIGAGLTQKSGALGSFFTGVLAVVVASPCTGPFMAGAIGYGATQPPAIALLIFAFLGLGFALPFALIGVVPALAKSLPKPGPWMAQFKEAMAFLVFATLIWLIWVLTGNLGQMGVAVGLLLVLAIGLVAWVNLRFTGKIGRLIGYVIALLLAASAILMVTNDRSELASAQTTAINEGGIVAEVWSPEAVSAAQADGKKIFVNFTADWCLTCKVNEHGALADPKVVAALSAPDTAYFIANWTKRDENIARALSSHGRSGVPLYLVYHAGQSDPIILPQLLRPSDVLDALK